MEFKSDPDIYTLKYIVLGDSTVGKTALINRYVHGGFAENGYNVNLFDKLLISFPKDHWHFG